VLLPPNLPVRTMHEFILFVKAGCNFCKKATSALKERNLSYKEINIRHGGEDLSSEVKEALEWDTYPMVLRKTEGNNLIFVGGCSDLLDLLNPTEGLEE